MMPRKKHTVAHRGYPGKDVGEPNLGEREFEVGKDEAWFAKIDRDFEGFSDLIFNRKHNAEEHSEEIRKISVRLLASMADNYDLCMKQHLERVNQANMQAAANIDQSNDTMLTLLVQALKEDGEATITIGRRKKGK